VGLTDVTDVGDGTRQAVHENRIVTILREGEAGNAGLKRICRSELENQTMRDLIEKKP
jgi:hypothetical protein